jgi:mRNA-degrading endonuclease toxin of MazEF toxin-antitoxin module
MEKKEIGILKNTSIKNFDVWNSIKKEINTKNQKIFFHEREIWFCKLGQNIGFEQNGKGKYFLRPVLILKKFNKYIFVGLPMTSVKKDKMFYFNLNNNLGSIILSQIRLIDSKRLFYKKSKITEKDFSKIKEKLKELIL